MGEKRKLKKALFITFLVVGLCSCSTEKEKFTDKKLNNNEIVETMSNHEVIILDVRTKSEYDEEHIKDAINIPLDEINKEIMLNKDKVILVYCRSGNRSKTAATKLIDLGYTAYDIGGISSINLEKESK